MKIFKINIGLSVLTSGILLSGSSVPVWSAGGSAQIYICIPSSNIRKSIFWNVSSRLVRRRLRSNLYLHSQFWQNEINFLKCQFPFSLPEALLKLIFAFPVLTEWNQFSEMSVPAWSAGGSAQIYFLIPVLTLEINFLKCQFPLGPPEALLNFAVM